MGAGEHVVNLWSVVSFDEGGYFDPLAPTRLTAPADGFYLIGVTVDLRMVDPGAVTIGVGLIKNNDGRFAGQYSLEDSGGAASAVTLIRLQAGDYMEAAVLTFVDSSIIQESEVTEFWMLKQG